MSWFQRLLLVTIFATFVLVVIGGTVRATDSGLGCPDWPTCHGKLIPHAEKHTLIEFSHRTAATVVGVLFLGVTFFALKNERRNPVVFWLAFSAGLLLAFQIVLGGITVKKELPSEIVAAHLGTAMLFMAVLIITANISIMRSRGREALTSAFASSSFVKMAVATAAVSFVTLALGSYISDTDAALACSGWPLCNGSVFPGGESAVGLHVLHRMLAGLLGIMLLATIYLAFEERRPSSVLAVAVASGAVYLAQALVGAANIWTELSAGVVVTHLSLAALLWCMLAWVCAASLYLPGREQARAAANVPKVAEWAR